MTKLYTLLFTVFLFFMATGGYTQTGAVLDFDGVNDYISVNTPAFTAYTVQVRLKFKRVAPTNQTVIVFTNGNPMSAWSHRIATTSDGRFFHYLYDGGAKSIIGNTTAVVDKWYTVSITASNSGLMRLYVDDVEDAVAQPIGFLWNGGNQFHIGPPSAGSTSWFNGEIDEVRI